MPRPHTRTSPTPDICAQCSADPVCDPRYCSTHMDEPKCQPNSRFSNFNCAADSRCRLAGAMSATTDITNYAIGGALVVAGILAIALLFYKSRS